VGGSSGHPALPEPQRRRPKPSSSSPRRVIRAIRRSTPPLAIGRGPGDHARSDAACYGSGKPGIPEEPAVGTASRSRRPSGVPLTSRSCSTSKPGMNAWRCTSSHRLIDPVRGAFVCDDSHTNIPPRRQAGVSGPAPGRACRAARALSGPGPRYLYGPGIQGGALPPVVEGTSRNRSASGALPSHIRSVCRATAQQTAPRAPVRARRFVMGSVTGQAAAPRSPQHSGRT